MAVSARPGCGGGSDKVKDEVGGKAVCVGRGSGAWDAAEGTGEERRLWEEGCRAGEDAPRDNRKTEELEP